MGMAASQARLLTITARMHDVEYQAQSIQNAKIALATQQDQVYQDFLDATSATTLVAKDYQGNMITANFNNICGLDGSDFVVPNSKNGRYVIFDENGRLVVPDDIYDAYQEYKEYGSDPYEFAIDYYELDTETESIVADSLRNVDKKLTEVMNSMDKIRERYDEDVYEEEGDCIDYSAYDDGDAFFDEWDEKDITAYKSLLSSYKSILYSRHFEGIQEEEGDLDDSDVSQKEFMGMVRWFEQIEAAGGCVPISYFNGVLGVGDVSSNSDWLKQMIGSGKLTIGISERDNTSGVLTVKATSIATDSGLEEVATTTIDKTAYARAEAEYEHKRKQLDQKDKRFDMDLSKLETERSALKTEYDSVKKVIEDNVERTFGIFS